MCERIPRKQCEAVFAGCGGAHGHVEAAAHVLAARAARERALRDELALLGALAELALGAREPRELREREPHALPVDLHGILLWK